MTESIVQIAERIRELGKYPRFRDVLAKKLNIPIETYTRYEIAQEGIPISVLYKIAAILNVELTELLTGSTPHLHHYCYVKNGEAPPIERYKGYQFQSLAFNFKGKKIEPLLVTIEPEENKKMELVTHRGQEFNYVLEGRIKIIWGH